MGINPDIIVLRCDRHLEAGILDKISMFCNVKPDCVIENMTLPVLYEAPVMLEKANLSSIVCRQLNIEAPEADLSDWTAMLSKISSRKKHVKNEKKRCLPKTGRQRGSFQQQRL